MFSDKVLPDGAGPVIDPPPAVLGCPGLDAVVELIRKPSSRHGREPVAAEPVDLPFDPAFLVRPGNTWLAVKSVEAVVRFRRAPSGRSPPLPAMPEDQGSDSAGEIVRPDVLCRDACQDLEGFNAAFPECFLGFSLVAPLDGLARMREPEYQHRALRLHPIQHHPDFTETHLGLGAVVSSVSITSIAGSNRSSRRATPYLGLRFGGAADSMARRTVRRTEVLDPGVSSDLCEQLHSRLHPGQPSIASIHPSTDESHVEDGAIYSRHKASGEPRSGAGDQRPTGALQTCHSPDEKTLADRGALLFSMMTVRL